MPKIKLEEASALFKFNTGYTNNGSNYFNRGLKIYRWMDCECDTPTPKFATVILKDNMSQCNTSGSCYNSVIKSTINSKNQDGTYTNNNSYSYSNSQYLRNRCKIYEQNLPASHKYINNELVVYGNCAESPDCASCPITYNPNNAQYSKQGGVSSSERLLRLKYNTVAGIINSGPDCCKKYIGDTTPLINIHKKSTICNYC